MQTVTLKLKEAHVEMIKELQIRNKLFRDLNVYLMRHIEPEYAQSCRVNKLHSIKEL